MEMWTKEERDADPEHFLSTALSKERRISMGLNLPLCGFVIRVRTSMSEYSDGPQSLWLQEQTQPQTKG